MKLLLINPTRTGFDSYVSPPLHLIYIAKAAEKIGHSAQIIDIHYDVVRQLKTQNSKYDLEQNKIEEILNMDFDVLGIGSIVSAFEFSKRLVNAVSDARADVPIIVGGGISIALKDLWASETKVDYLVESDGEMVIQKFLENYPDKEKLRKIPGLHVRKNDEFVAECQPELPKILDYIDFPDWGYLDNLEDYMNIQKGWLNATLPAELQLKDEDRVLPIVMTRGCPYKCTFCYHINNFYRNHSVDYVIKYLKHLKEVYGINFVVTWDDLIMANQKWLADLCDALINENLDMRIFTSGGKPNLITRELLKKMKKAGFVRISYGIESGSQRVLNIMKKQTTVEQNYNAVKMSIQEGIFTHLNMVLGMPGEKLSTLRETLNFLASLAGEGLITSRNLSFSFATGYPGTELYQYMIDKQMVKNTEEYLRTQTGVGGYKYNLCGLNVNVLKMIRNIAFARVDYRYYSHTGKYEQALKAVFRGVAKTFFEIFLPASVQSFIKDKLNRKRLRI